MSDKQYGTFTENGQRVKIVMLEADKEKLQEANAALNKTIDEWMGRDLSELKRLELELDILSVKFKAADECCTEREIAILEQLSANAALVKKNSSLKDRHKIFVTAENAQLQDDIRVLKKRWADLEDFVKEYLGGYERHVNNFAEEILEKIKELQALDEMNKKSNRS